MVVGVLARGRVGAALTARCNALWIGSALGAVERACLRSVLRQGHEVTLWCYDDVGGVPAGVEVADGSDVLPRTTIVRHRATGSVSLFSNRFRYELQRIGAGTWIDCDVYLLRRLDLTSAYLLVEQSRGTLNTGVLRLPTDAPILPPLLEVFEERSVPPWLPPRARAAAWWRRLVTGRTGIDRMPWGSAGPQALTAIARRTGLLELAHPPETHCPVPWQQAGWIVDTSVALEDVVSPTTVAVHLWNERIKGYKDLPAPPGSFLARLQAEAA